MSLKPLTTRLSKRRRCVLYARAMGWDQPTIADRLGVSMNVINKDIVAINKTLVPGVTDGDHPAKSYRLVYVLGLLDAGADPDDIPHHLRALEDRIKWLMATGTDDTDIRAVSVQQ